MNADPCPRGGDHNWVNTREGGGWVTHTCAKCKTGVTRRQGAAVLAVSLEDVARVAHEANRAWQVATADPAVSPHWDDAPRWQRESAIDGVGKALEGCGPEELHDAWWKRKLGEGWTYGPVKDDVAKTHPDMLPYGELPDSERVKGALFVAIVTTLGGR